MRARVRKAIGTLTAVVLATTLLAVPQPSMADDHVPNPQVEGPVTGGIWGRPWHSSLVDLEPRGFVEEEYFISGTSMGAPYKTRMVVRRPADGDFSGSVVVEWLNVTGGRDLETAWPTAYPTFLDERHAYVALTAQVVGANGLKAWDPVRYATLVHPGDTPFSYDILAQAVQAVRSPGGVDPMGGLDVTHVVVQGASQSAGRLHSYITEGYPIAGHIDGFSLDRTGGSAAVAAIAAELEVPMLKGIEENLTAPDDHEYWVVWEGAGQAHAPLAWYDYVHRVNQRDLLLGNEAPNAVAEACGMNRGTVQYQSRAQVHWMHRWLANGERPPTAPRIERQGGSLVRDQDGNALGGLRYPFIDVPLGLHTSGDCPLFGHSRTWTRDKIIERYPTHDVYYGLVESSVDSLVDGGFLLLADAEEILAEAAAFDIWDRGSCWETEDDVDESGPVSSALGGQRAEHAPAGFAVPGTMAATSCTLASLGL